MRLVLYPYMASRACILNAKIALPAYNAIRLDVYRYDTICFA